MKIEDFCRELEGLGFTALEPRPLASDPYMNFYDAPPRLADTIQGIGVGVGGASGKEYHVTFQAADGLEEKSPIQLHSYPQEVDGQDCEIRELGWALSPFSLPCDEHLLDALRGDGKNLLTWLYAQPVMTINIEGAPRRDAVITAGNEVLDAETDPNKLN